MGRNLARMKRAEVGATWCITESGACGPTFNFVDVTAGFTSIFVSGPVEKGVFIESHHNNREENMWSFTKVALDLLAECVEEAMARGAGGDAAETPILVSTEDRYGGVEVTVADGSPQIGRFDCELKESLRRWQSGGKRGVWLKLPLRAAAYVGPGVANGFS